MFIVNTMNNADDHVVLYKLDPQKRFKGNEVCVLTGMKEGGKTTTIFDHLRLFADRWYDGIVLCKSEPSQSIKSKLRYRAIMPPIAVYTTHDVKKILAYMEYAVKWNADHGQNPWRFIVCDDFSFDQATFKGKEWSEIITTARHIPIMVFIVLHSLKYLCQMRDLLEYVYIFHTPKKKLIKWLWEEFGGVIEKPQVFERTFRHYTSAALTSLVIDTKCADEDPRRSIFWYQATPANKMPPFTICLNRALWDKSRRESKYPTPRWIEPTPSFSGSGSTTTLTTLPQTINIALPPVTTMDEKSSRWIEVKSTSAPPNLSLKRPPDEEDEDDDDDDNEDDEEDGVTDMQFSGPPQRVNWEF